MIGQLLSVSPAMLNFPYLRQEGKFEKEVRKIEDAVSNRKKYVVNHSSYIIVR